MSVLDCFLNCVDMGCIEWQHFQKQPSNPYMHNKRAQTTITCPNSNIKHLVVGE
jgi:hypothetical protein